MRRFDYKKDYILINSSVKGYINELEKELELLIELEGEQKYFEALEIIKKFKEEYPNLNIIYEQVINDLTSPYCVEYCFENNCYPKDASIVGEKFELALQKIILLEDELRTLAVRKWSNCLTNYEEIENGNNFMVVGHASFQLPGIDRDDDLDKNNCNRVQYISCSLFSHNELNTFQDQKIVYLVDVHSENYISSSYTDSVTSDLSEPSFHTLKDIKKEKIHYIKVGYTTDFKECVTSILTPKCIEKLSVEREVKENGEMFEYRHSQTNEIVLDRNNVQVIGILLISNGCDLLLGEYIHLKEKRLEFKCINKGLYRENVGLKAYTENEYEEFKKKLYQLEEYIHKGIIQVDILKGYYNDVIIPMNYNAEIMAILNEFFSKYIDIEISRK